MIQNQFEHHFETTFCLFECTMYRRKREIAELQGNVVEANLEPVPRASSPVQKEVAMTELDIDNVTLFQTTKFIYP